MCPMERREQRAFENVITAIDMKDQFERLSINNHKSFLPHLCVYKVRHVPTFRMREKVLGQLALQWLLYVFFFQVSRSALHACNLINYRLIYVMCVLCSAHATFC